MVSCTASDGSWHARKHTVAYCEPISFKLSEATLRLCFFAGMSLRHVEVEELRS